MSRSEPSAARQSNDGFGDSPWRRMVITTLGVLLAIFLVAPFLWLVTASFMHDADLLNVPTRWIPQHPTWDNYAYFFNPTGDDSLRSGGAAEGLPRALLNSLIIALLVTLGNLLLGGPAAYAFARLRFPGSHALLMLYITTRMIPAVAIIIPLYLVFVNIHLLNTVFAPAIAHTLITLPFTIWILKSYFQTIPQELEDAARVDRCGRPQAVLRVLVPVAAPGLMAAAMFAFLTSWADFLLSSSLTRSITSSPSTVIIAQLATDPYTPRTQVAAGAVLAVLPPVVLAVVFQRVIVNGLVSGSVKG